MTNQYAAASRSQLDSIVSRCRDKLRRNPDDVLEEWAGHPMALSELTRESASNFIDWLADGNGAPAEPEPAPDPDFEASKQQAYDAGFETGFQAMVYQVVMYPDGVPSKSADDVPLTAYVKGYAAGAAEAREQILAGRNPKALFLGISDEEAEHAHDPIRFHREKSPATPIAGWGTLSDTLRP